MALMQSAINKRQLSRQMKRKQTAARCPAAWKSQNFAFVLCKFS
jgi:hypothetical protein